MAYEIRPAKNSGNVNRGQWRVLKTRNKFSALLRCPQCGTEMNLLDHTISKDGAVKPDVVCPNTACSFTEQVVLAGWA